MKERPILFSGPMVLAILAGHKTQTRRVVRVPWRGSSKALPYEPYFVDTDGELQVMDEYGVYHPFVERFRTYGEPVDRLWVRETWGVIDDVSKPMSISSGLCLRATQPDAPICWRPSIHMPRWASRISLEVTGVRVERLQCITEEGAQAEGAPKADSHRVYPSTRAAMVQTHHAGFVHLWESINGKRDGCAWNDNPWVWVIEFKRVQ